MRLFSLSTALSSAMIALVSLPLQAAAPAQQKTQVPGY